MFFLFVTVILYGHNTEKRFREWSCCGKNLTHVCPTSIDNLMMRSDSKRGFMQTNNTPPQYTLQGFGIDLELHADRIVLRKQGEVAQQFQDEPDREIYLRDITAASLVEGFTVWNGYLKCEVNKSAGLPVMVVYHRENEAAAEQMKNLINEQVAKLQAIPAGKKSQS
jgi:hypothetical protein